VSPPRQAKRENGQQAPAEVPVLVDIPRVAEAATVCALVCLCYPKTPAGRASRRRDCGRPAATGVLLDPLGAPANAGTGVQPAVPPVHRARRGRLRSGTPRPSAGTATGCWPARWPPASWRRSRRPLSCEGYVNDKRTML